MVMKEQFTQCKVTHWSVLIDCGRQRRFMAQRNWETSTTFTIEFSSKHQLTANKDRHIMIHFFIFMSCTLSAQPSWVYKTPEVQLQGLNWSFHYEITNYFDASSKTKCCASSPELYREGSLPEAQLMFFIITQPKEISLNDIWVNSTSLTLSQTRQQNKKWTSFSVSPRSHNK